MADCQLVNRGERCAIPRPESCDSICPRANLTLALILVFLILVLSVALSAQAPSSTFATLSAKADAARNAEHFDEAVSLYRKALVLRPGWAEGWWWLGTIQYERNVYEEAATAFRKVTLLPPPNGTAFVMLGLSEFELGRDTLALAHIEKGLDMGVSKDITFRQVATYHKGILLQRQGSFGPAQEVLERLCLSGAQTDNVANVLGMTMLLMTDKNVPRDPALADAVLRVGRADCLSAQKKGEQARPLFEQVVKDHPDLPNIHYAYGLFLLELYDLSGGVEQLKEEIKRDPKHLLARLRIASAYYKQDSAAGIPFAEQAVKLAPEHGFAHYMLGLLLLDTNQYVRAIPELETAKKTFTEDAKLYFALGSAYSRAGRKQDAARARATFERLNQKSTTAPAERDNSEVRGALKNKVPPGTTAPGPQ